MFIATMTTELYSTFWRLYTEKNGDLKLEIWLVTLPEHQNIATWMDGAPYRNNYIDKVLRKFYELELKLIPIASC